MDEKKSITIFQADSFTDTPFKGNPAGVCISEEPLDDELMQNIAAEMNLSETAFAVPKTKTPISKTDKFKLRWFTPKCEVNLCGHATLATARVLYDIFEVKSDTLTFSTRSGELITSRQDDLIQLDFPAGDPQPVELPEYMINALNLFESGQDKLIHGASMCSKTKILLVRFTEPGVIYSVSPNFKDLIDAEEAMGTGGIAITSEGDGSYDFISRFFAPCYGIDEDPVTGAAHTVLTPYWAVMLKKKKMIAFQASKRGGEVLVEFKDDPKWGKHRVLLSGRAVIIMEGVIRI